MTRFTGLLSRWYRVSLGKQVASTRAGLTTTSDV